MVDSFATVGQACQPAMPPQAAASDHHHLPYTAHAIPRARIPMPTYRIQHTVETDGRIVLEGLPVRRGQHVRITIVIEEDAPAPPLGESDASEEPT